MSGQFAGAGEGWTKETRAYIIKEQRCSGDNDGARFLHSHTGKSENEGLYHFSPCSGRGEKDDIELHEILEALLTGTVIEEYPSDPRGHSCLAHGCCAGRNLHVCCGMRGSRAAIITVYIPDPEKWIDFTKRRRP